MDADRTGWPLRRVAGAIAAIAVAAGSATFSAGPAGAQTAAELDIAKSVSQPTAAPLEDFIYFLTYSCSSLTQPCEGATVTDTLPPEVTRAAAEVQFGGNFADVTYNPATGTAVFTLFSPLPAGTTAQVSITVHFPAGTAPGTTATNTATMNAANAPPAQSNQVTVTARAASRWTVTKGQVTSAAQLDTPFTYRVAITLSAGGTQNIANARFVDTLPPGAQFVSASGGGTYDPGANTVSWPLGTLVPNANNDVTTSREVTVIFPSTTFQAGDAPVNRVEAFGAPAGDPDQSLGLAMFPVTLREAGDITSASKQTELSSLGHGQSDTYTIRGANPNPGPLDSFTLLEDLPVALTMTQDGAPNLTGSGTAPQVAWRPLGGGAFQPIATSPSGGGWGATIPASADEVRLSYGTVPADFVATAAVRAGLPASGIGRDGVPIAAGSNIRNCVTVSGSSNGTAAVPRSACTDQTVVPLAVRFTKTRTSAAVVPPGADVAWEIGVGVEASSAASLVNPAVTDCLPPSVDLVDPSNPSNPANGAVTGLPTPVVTRGSCGTNQVLLTWSWPGVTLPSGSSGTIALNSRVSTTARPGLLTNVATLAGANVASVIERTAEVTVTSATLLLGTKLVRGDLDAGFVGSGTIGRTTPGGSATYQAVIQNSSDVPVTGLVVIDTMPIPGDTGVVSPDARGSTWQPLFDGGIATGPPTTVWYSRSHNPCRPDFTAATGCEAPNWSTTPPSPLSAVGAIRVDYGDFVLPPAGAVRLTWNMATPTSAPVGQIAWNSFGYTATRADSNEALPPSEPGTVGLEVRSPVPAAPGISLVVLVNGVPSPTPPGQAIADGAPVVFTYRITNTGGLTLNNLVLTDDTIGTITCPRATLAPGDAMACTSASYPAVPGPHTNTATVSGQPVDAAGNNAGAQLTDTSQGHYYVNLPPAGAGASKIAMIGGLLLAIGLAAQALARRHARTA